MAQTVIDRCMQIHGAGGLTSDYFMAEAFNYARWCRQADGPDQVHMMALGKDIIARGVAPGPEVAKRLGAFERAWVAAGFPNDTETIAALLDAAAQS